MVFRHFFIKCIFLSENIEYVKKKVRNYLSHIPTLAGFIIVGVKVSSILIGYVRPALANRRQCRPGSGRVRKMRDPVGVSAALQWQGGGGKVADFLISLSHI